jgi:predicted RNA-binding Zn-ribbon protein involved in translation (DUF1610 family)
VSQVTSKIGNDISPFILVKIVNEYCIVAINDSNIRVQVLLNKRPMTEPGLNTRAWCDSCVKFMGNLTDHWSALVQVGRQGAPILCRLVSNGSKSDGAWIELAASENFPGAKLPLTEFSVSEYSSDDAFSDLAAPETTRESTPQKVKGETMAAATRHCLTCGYSGQMKTWLGNYTFPKFLALIGLLFYVIPGLIFIAWGWGKYKCPNCGALAKNASDVGAPNPATTLQSTPDSGRVERSCPWCAEQILVAAKICKHCGRDVTSSVNTS